MLTARFILWTIVLSGVCWSAPVSRQTWDTESGLPQNTVKAILQTHDGYLWFATEGGLARFDSARFTVFNTRNTPQLRSNDTRGLLEDSEGTLWIATADGVNAITGRQFRAFTTAAGLPSNEVTRLYKDSSGHTCAVTVAGAACLEQARFVPTAAVVPVPAIDPAWRALVSSGVLCTYADREGDVWIGTESTGVTIIRKLHFEAFTDRANGLDVQVRCVYQDRLGAAWFGTNSQGLTRYYQGKFSRYTAANGLSSNVIVSLGEAADGDLLIGTPDGLNRLHKGVITLITSSEGLPDDFIRSIHTDPDGTVWIGTRRGLARLQNGKFQTFTHADGLGSDLIGSISRDGAGQLWVATLDGLSKLDGKRFKTFSRADGLSSNVITALYADAAGVLWVGTQGGGLNRLVDGRITRVAAPEVIYGITGDMNQDLWLASDTGVFRVIKDTHEVVSYGVSDGMRVYECSGGGHPGIASSPDGAIWFATLKGAALLVPSVPFNRIPPTVVVESVTVDNRTLDSESAITVGPGASRLSFDYAALSFAAPQKVRYRYRLVNFDKNWLDAGASRTAFYTNLSPGQYKFEVIARNGDGLWNQEGATLGLKLEPHYYQTWWFAGLVAVLLALTAFSVYRWRLARVQAQVESRYEAVLEERNRIAREIHDTLAQGFAGVSVQLELVSRKLGSTAGAVRDHLDQARMLVRSSLSEARRSIWELRSQSSEIEDLASRLSKMAAQMSGPGQPKIGVQVRGTFRPLPPRTEDELLRIAQEAVTNAIRHARASEISIELAFDPKLLRMTVADDGRGFEPNGQTTGVHGHFGLQGIEERANALDAKLNLATAPGAGTRLSVEVAV